jgi:hypothetical protein
MRHEQVAVPGRAGLARDGRRGAVRRPLYPYVAVFAIVSGVITLVTAHGRDKFLALAPLCLVPFWVARWREYRRSRSAG